MRGRVRAPGSASANRYVLDRDWHVAPAPAGSIATPDKLESAGLEWTQTTVPNTAAGALRAAGAWTWNDPRRFDAEDWWWYVRIPADVAPGGWTLHTAGIATLHDVWWNDELVRSGTNMFVGACDRVVVRGGDVLAIRCRALDPELAKKRARPRWRVPMLEQQQLRWVRTTLLGRTPGWSPPIPAVGPWRPVWLERAAVPIEDVAIDARLNAAGSAGVVAITARLGPDVERVMLVVEREAVRVEVALTAGGGAWSGSAVVDSPQRWWPHTHGEPARYAVQLAGTCRGAPFIIDLGHTGFRTIAVERLDDDFALRVNDVPVFCRGACWTPLDPVTLGADPEAYRAAIVQAQSAGMNMLRVAGTMVYEDDAFLDALDAHGILLWQDLMFANMDYPDDPELAGSIAIEVDQQLARLAARPSLAVVCGNSEVQQQAAMSGAGRERWAPPLFHEVLAAAARRHVPGVQYIASSTDGGAFPHQPNAGASSYYGVGAYRRPLDDARRSEVRFASECLAFANIPVESGLPGGPAIRAHHPAWKARSPRDLGAGWDFDDIRDHYVQRLFEVDPTALRASDHERYLALGRIATGEVMARTFAEWRRKRSPTRGGLVWFLRDLWPGAGWGVVDAHGVPKPCWYALRRALAPVSLAITDEGCNGLAIHAINDRAAPLAGRIELTLYRDGEIRAGHGSANTVVPARGAIELAAAALFDGFFDLSYAYRFGPPQAHVVHARLVAGEAQIAEAFYFPAGLALPHESAIGLTATVSGDVVTIATRRFAQFVTIEAAGALPDDNGFHLAPGHTRAIRVRSELPIVRGTISALNAQTGVRFEIRA